MKSIFQFSLSRNLSLSLQFVPSRSNPMDSPSPTLSDLDASLDVKPRNLVDSTFRLHTINLMALPSNVKLDRSGHPLKFFSLFHCVQAQGTNVFSQVLSSSENAFVFPKFTLIGPLLKFLVSQPCPFTIIAPDVSPRKYWWPLLWHQATVAFKLGQRRITQFFYYPLNQANLLENSDHLNGIFRYFVLLHFNNLTYLRFIVKYKLEGSFFSFFL